MTESEFNNLVVDLYTELYNDCLDRIIAQRASPERSVAIIRENNRKWNKYAADYPLVLKKDGFLDLFKKRLGELNLPEVYKAAFRYL